MILYFYSSYEYKIHNKTTEIHTLKNIYKNMTSWNASRIQFHSAWWRRTAPFHKYTSIVTNGFFLQITNFTHPAFGAEIESKVGHYPWFYTNNQLRTALSFFLRSGPFVSRKKGALESWKLFLLGMFWDGDLLQPDSPFWGSNHVDFNGPQELILRRNLTKWRSP